MNQLENEKNSETKLKKKNQGNRGRKTIKPILFH